MQERLIGDQGGDLANKESGQSQLQLKTGQNGAGMETTHNPQSNTLNQSTQAPAFPVQTREPQEVLAEQALMVHRARQTVAGLRRQMDQLRREFDLQNAGILQALDQARADVAAKEAVLRALALTVYQETGSKSPGGGTTVREMTRTRYDRQAALTWALERRLFVVLDSAAFEKFARSNPAQVPFVQVYREPEATISQDLDHALGVQ